MVSIKQAVQVAENALADLYDSPDGVQLEEVGLSDDEKYWRITLSFLAPRDSRLSISGALAERLRERQYKTLEINRQTGEFHGMTMRLVPSV